jgi:short-subunit dehydrogenase
MEVSGKVVLITGASSGIGAATAHAMARRGARTVLVARRLDALRAVADQIGAGGRSAHVYDADLADGDAVARTAKRVSADVGVPDVIVNNAGAGRYLAIDETDPREAVQMMAVPYFAAFFTTRAFIEGMLKRGSGHIVNVTSPASRLAWPGATAYVAARWAMEGFTWALRADLRGTGVSAGLVTAGKTATPYFDNNPGSEERIPAFSRLLPTLAPEQVAEAVVRAVEGERSFTVVPALLRGVYVTQRIAPGAVSWLLGRTGWRRPPARRG